jgi:hypothetical protein
MKLTNETDKEGQRDEREMEDNETEEESDEDKSDPEDESHGTIQELLDNQFGRDLRRQLEQDLGVFDSQWRAERSRVRRDLLGTTESKSKKVVDHGSSTIWNCLAKSIPTNTAEKSTDAKVTGTHHFTFRDLRNQRSGGQEGPKRAKAHSGNSWHGLPTGYDPRLFGSPRETRTMRKPIEFHMLRLDSQR